MKSFTEEQCWDALVRVIHEILDEMGEEPGVLAPQTMINADLGLSSVEAIHLAIMLEHELRVPLKFEELAVRDGEYVDDLSLAEWHEFVLRSVGLQG